jgi:hypothetical protein
MNPGLPTMVRQTFLLMLTHIFSIAQFCIIR